jgi:hypothetical protein
VSRIVPSVEPVNSQDELTGLDRTVIARFWKSLRLFVNDDSHVVTVFFCASGSSPITTSLGICRHT